MNSIAPRTDLHLAYSFNFLSKLQELCTQSETASAPIWTVGEDLGLSEEDAELIASELQEVNMLHYTSLAGDVALTSFGVSEIILARSQPEVPTTHFPALSTFTDQMLFSFDSEASVWGKQASSEASSVGLHNSISKLEQTLETQDFSKSLVAELEDLCLELQN